tara:strand:+ start:6779 stop:7336 length:558 start_codon:yes stop_codon:yes gene_type:complete
MTFPMVFENITNQEDINLIIDYLDNNSKDFGELSEQNYWQGRTLFYHQVKNPEVQNVMLESLKSVVDKLENLTSKKVFCEHFSIARWPEGYDLQPHADAENPPGCPPHDYPWRDFGIVTFLNEDFEGGLLYYPERNIEIKPKKGHTAIHLGSMDCLHGVTKITKGSRYTIAAFLTYDEGMKAVDL